MTLFGTEGLQLEARLATPDNVRLVFHKEVRNLVHVSF